MSIRNDIQQIVTDGLADLYYDLDKYADKNEIEYDEVLATLRKLSPVNIADDYEEWLTEGEVNASSND